MPARKSLERLLEEALQRPESERVGFLDEHCGDDGALRQQLSQLLQHHEQARASGFLPSRPQFTAGEATGPSSPPLAVTIGDQTAGPPAGVECPLPADLGRYEVERVLGRGGFGVVYLARDPQLDRRVAIKLPHSERFAAPAGVEMYLHEARTLAQLDHPGIVPVYDCGQTGDGRPFVVSKYVAGANLREVMSHRRFSCQEAAALVAAVAEALQHAHRAGIVHRDIKPDNILLEAPPSASGTPRPLVADFGIALRPEAFGQGPPSCGTIAYMSPEQAGGRAATVDGRSDIYSLGVVLYELLTGQRPYRAQGVASLLAEIADETIEVRPPRQLDASLPPEVEQICLRALAKRPADRYSNAADLAADLRASSGRNEDRIAPNGRRRPGLWVAVVVAAVAAAGAIWGLVGPPRHRGGHPVSAPMPAAVAPLRVVRMDVEHFANLNNQFDQPRGILGKQSFAPRLQDSVTVQAQLSRPAYAYLIAFRPDGVDELCFPEDDNQAPPMTDRPRYPSVSREVNYGLNEGTGLWVFAVVASDQPLPPYRQWRAQHAPPAFPPTEAPTNVVLWDDGRWLESLAAGGVSRGARGKGVPTREQPPRAAVVRITDWLKQAAQTEAVGAIGFGVLPRG